MDLTKLDPEVVDLCVALNKLPGIQTIASCCGHGKDEYNIWFVAEDLEDLPPALYYFDKCHCGFSGWKVVVTTDCAMSPVHFRIDGPTGEQAYTESQVIAGIIEKYVAQPQEDE